MKAEITLFVCLVVLFSIFCRCTKESELLEGEFGTEYSDTSNSNDLPPEIEKLQENMILVEGGSFTMGCTDEHGDECFNNEKPTHNVTLSGFYIGKYEVSFSKWEAVTGEYPSSYDECAECPVTQVSPDDFQDFLDSLNSLTGKNYRLPTEAEWEFAARGGSKATPTLYAGSDDINDAAWYSENSNEQARTVGEKQPNELGLYDMSGNVWEWCSDYYGEYTDESETNPDGPQSGSNQVLRGGSFSDAEAIIRIPRRNSYSPSTRSGNFGYRLALDE